MQRFLLIGALSAALLAGAAVAYSVRTSAPEHAIAVTRHGHDETPSAVYTDPRDASPVTPPDSQLDRIRPHDPKLATQDTTPVPVPPVRPNIVLMLGCTVRKDQVTPYGGLPTITPTLQRMAERGTLFDDLVAAAPWTRPASIAILTGRHAVSTGAVEVGPGRDDSRLPDDVVLLSERLQERGYLTVGATSNPNLSADFGFAQGFDVYQPGLPDSWGSKVTGKQIADTMVAAVKSKRAAGDMRPVYLGTMMLEAHTPRNAHGDQLTDYRESGVPERVAQYRYHLHRLDAALGYYLDELAKIGIDESNTVFVFVGDHGEGLSYPGIHGFGHGQYFGSSSAYVPWILEGVGVAVGHRVLGTASQIDITPTLLGLIGAPLTAQDITDGRDWSALVRGEPGVVSNPWVISDTWFATSSRAAIFSPYFQCQDDFGSAARLQQKHRNKFVPGCYDRYQDVLFTTPIPQTDPRTPELTALQTTLATWREEQTAALTKLVHENASVSSGLADQLRTLGYVEGATHEDEAHGAGGKR